VRLSGWDNRLARGYHSSPRLAPTLTLPTRGRVRVGGRGAFANSWFSYAAFALYETMIGVAVGTNMGERIDGDQESWNERVQWGSGDFFVVPRSSYRVDLSAACLDEIPRASARPRDGSVVISLPTVLRAPG